MTFSPTYEQQVGLILKTMPEVAKIEAFALHGGTAINLFLRDLPRLSVDIDLTYVPIEDRQSTLSNIQSLLQSLQDNLQQRFSYLSIQNQAQKGKLLISQGQVKIKIEVNLVKRGCLSPPQMHFLCDKASEHFDAFVAMPMVGIGQVYGGKFCAALDRQHPRDLFDVKHLLDSEGITDVIKIGFLLYLLSGSRPVHEILSPNFKDQRSAFNNQFQGMTGVPFPYSDFEITRERMVRDIHSVLTKQDKTFIYQFHLLDPKWTIYDFDRFPAIQWKLQHLRKLKKQNIGKYEKQLDALQNVLSL